MQDKTQNEIAAPVRSWMTKARSLGARWRDAARNWQRNRRLLAQLGSADESEREAALAQFLWRGESALPILWSVLHGPVVTACGAAVALTRLGRPESVRVILQRCYEEEWLLRCVEEGYLQGIRALRFLDRDVIGNTMLRALDTAENKRTLRACVRELTLALSALRVLFVLEGVAPLAWWERALQFGHRNLRRLSESPSVALAYNLTDFLRLGAARGLLHQYPTDCFEAFARALEQEDPTVQRIGIYGLCRLHNRRALPLLQSIAFQSGHPLANLAREAIADIAGADADPLVLLRTASEENAEKELLHIVPATPADAETSSLLLRPVCAPEPQETPHPPLKRSA